MVTGAGGKRAGARRGARPKRPFQPVLVGLALGITGAVIAWGYLVYLAILHGQTIRTGDSDAWAPAAAAGVGAVACLFVGFVLVARLLRLLAMPAPTNSATATPVSPGGGHRVQSDDA